MKNGTSTVRKLASGASLKTPQGAISHTDFLEKEALMYSPDVVELLLDLGQGHKI